MLGSAFGTCFSHKTRGKNAPLRWDYVGFITGEVLQETCISDGFFFCSDFRKYKLVGILGQL